MTAHPLVLPFTAHPFLLPLHSTTFPPTPHSTPFPPPSSQHTLSSSLFTAHSFLLPRTAHPFILPSKYTLSSHPSLFPLPPHSTSFLPYPDSTPFPPTPYSTPFLLPFSTLFSSSPLRHTLSPSTSWRPTFLSPPYITVTPFLLHLPATLSSLTFRAHHFFPITVHPFLSPSTPDSTLPSLPPPSHITLLLHYCNSEGP